MNRPMRAYSTDNLHLFILFDWIDFVCVYASMSILADWIVSVQNEAHIVYITRTIN